MTSTIQEVAAIYGDWMASPLLREYYGHSDFFNTGYWHPETTTQAEACVNLVETLLARLPEKRGTILDVACGTGATTRHLLKYYPASAIAGINISEWQLGRSRANAPGCSFALMDAAAMALSDRAFAAILCVEAAFHFRTRQRFLCEAYRVLQPGGALVLSDMMFGAASGIAWLTSRNDQPANLREYRALYQQAGFTRVEVVDATPMCWGGFCRNLIAWTKGQAFIGALNKATVEGLSRLLDQAAVERYLLACAWKPEKERYHDD